MQDGSRVRYIGSDPLATAAVYRLHAAALLEEAAKPADRRDRARLQAILTEPPWPPWYNARGRRLLIDQAEASLKLLADLDYWRAGQRTTVAAIAIKLFLEQHERLPRQWDELVADGLLAEAPRDPWTGGPMGYDPQKALLTFAGPKLGYAYFSDNDVKGQVFWEKARAQFQEPAEARLSRPASLNFVPTEWPSSWSKLTDADYDRIDKLREEQQRKAAAQR